MTRVWMIVAALALVFGCSTAPVQMPSVDSQPLPEPARTPFHLTMEYSSDLADPYYVTSGPADSYARYPISAQFRALLERQTAHLNTPGSSRRATLTVHVTELTTRFHQLGAAPGSPSLLMQRYASHGQAPMVVPASFFGGMDRGDGNSDIPEEIHKSATLITTLELRGDGIPTVQRTVTTDHTDVLEKWDYHPRTSYSYTETLDRTLRAAAGEITAVVQANLK